MRSPGHDVEQLDEHVVELRPQREDVEARGVWGRHAVMLPGWSQPKGGGVPRTSSRRAILDSMQATEIQNKALILDLIEWVAAGPRGYGEVMEAWRTSCPRLPVWEDACDHGFVAREVDGAGRTVVRATAAGVAFLRAERG